MFSFQLFDKHRHNFAMLNDNKEFDVCIVGSGPAGTIVGTNLAKAGIRTVILESGYNMAAWLFDKRVKALAHCEVTGNAGYPTVRTKARLVGGNSNFWTGRSNRLLPSDFTQSNFIPKNNPWPIAYQDIETYYEKAEQSLSVRGLSPSPHMGPRSSAPPVRAKTDIAPLQAILSRAGVIADYAHTATPKKDFRFFRFNSEILPEFLTSDSGMLVTGAIATRLHTAHDRRVTAVETRTIDGGQAMVRARIYVLACGGIETPRLLLLSRDETYPEGIGNSHDRVGRCFMEHPSSNYYAQITHSSGTMKPSHKVARIFQWYESLRDQGLGAVMFSSIQSFAFPHHLLPPHELAIEVFRIPGRFARPTLYLGPNIEQKPIDTNRVTLSENKKDIFGNPVGHLHFDLSDVDFKTFAAAKDIVMDVFDKVGTRSIREGPITFARHHMGTCRMGDDPRTSVVDRNLCVHDCSNLYLAGAETFVTGGAVEPTLTIVALAHRLSDQIKQELTKI